MRSRLFPASLVLLSASVLGPASAASQQPSLFQELGAFAISASSKHREVPSPAGFGVAAWWQFGRYLAGRLSFHRVQDETTKSGVVCDEYSQRLNCRLEETHTDVTLSGLRGTLLGTVVVGGHLRLAAGGGLSFNHIDARAVGSVSDRVADLLAPNAGIIGFASLVSATLQPLSSVPVRLSGNFGVHWVNFKTCSANDPPQYDPFCGMESLKELEFGLSYVF